ncbi:MAG: RNA methyltransferase [Actinomycetota bacterium]|nr:RNA methyltransferase [Actinomycetota bacterium]
MTPVPVDDPNDERVADFLRLNDPDLRRLREQTGGAEGGFFVAEGVMVIRHLLRSPYRLRSVLVTPQGLAALEGDLNDVTAPVYLVPQQVMSDVTGFHFHRGALATADRGPLPTDVLDVVGRSELVVMAEGVNDNENLGALFRNAAAFGAGAVVLDAGSADPLYRRSVRVSMGLVLRIPFTRADDTPGVVRRLQGVGYEVLALTPSPAAVDVREVAPRSRQVLLVGAEGPGLSEAAMAAADRRVRIAMAPGVDSLNVATAAAVALHHLSSGG